MPVVLKWMNPEVAKVRPYEPGRPIETVARELGLDPATICKLASNENPLGPSRRARLAVRRNLEHAHLYPDGYAFELREKVAAAQNVKPGQILFGNGSNEIIEFLGHAFLGPERSLVVSQYAFVVYKLVAQMFGGRVIEVPAKEMGHNLSAMARAVEHDTSMIIVCNPNNPTGTLAGEAQVHRFLDHVPANVLVVFDEAYAEICLGRMPDTIGLVREGRPNVICLRSFSKAYGLAGLRIGYAVGPESVIQALERSRQPFNVNRLAQDAAVAALDDQAFLTRTRRTFRRGRDQYEEACRELGLEFVRSYANFILIKVGDGAHVTRELMKRGVIVRPMAPYQLPEYIRISFGLPDENTRCVAALKEILPRKS